MGDERERERLRRSPSPGAIVAALAIGGLTSSFMQTIIIPIQYELPTLLDAPRSDTAWVVTITLLTAAVTTPIAGRLGDMFGKRRIALAVLAIMVVGCVVAATSHDIVGMIIGRGLQGVGMGILPLGISIMRDVLPERRLGSGIALMSATMGIGGAIGLPLAAFAAEQWDYHALFWIAGAIGLLSLLLILAIVPVSVLRSLGRFDWVGAIGLAIGIVGILLALSSGGEWGWLSPPTLGVGLGGVAVLLLWGWYELRDRNPLVDLRVAARRPVLLANLSSLLLSFGLFSFNIGIPQFLENPVASQAGLGLSLMEASLGLLPFGFTILLVSPIAGRLMGVVGPKPLMVAGGVLVAIAYVVCLLWLHTLWSAMVVNVIAAAGIGAAFAAAPSAIMRAVPMTETAAANGINSLMRSVGTTLAAAMIGVVLSAITVQVGDVMVPSWDAFQLAFVLGLVAALASSLLAAFIPRHRPCPAGEHPSLPA